MPGRSGRRSSAPGLAAAAAAAGLLLLLRCSQFGAGQFDAGRCCCCCAAIKAERPQYAHRTEGVASLGVLLAGVFFSTGPLIFRSTTGEATALQYIFWRFVGLAAVAAAGLAGMVMLFARRPRPLRQDALGGPVMCGCNICFIVALERVDSATVLLLQSLAPWSGALLGWLLLKEPVDKTTGCTMALATAVVGIMGTEWGQADVVGLGASIAIAVLLGAYAVLLRRISPKATDAEKEDKSIAAAVEAALRLALGTAIAGFAIITPANLIAPPHSVSIATKDALLGATAGSLCLGVGLPLFSAAGKYIPAARTNLLLLSEILLGPLWTWIFIGEEYGIRTLIGGGLLLAALVWLTAHPSDEKAATGEAAAKVNDDEKADNGAP